MILFESDSHFFDRHVGPGVQFDYLPAARFSRGQDCIASHKPNAAENAE